MATIILATLSDTNTLEIWQGTDLLLWRPVGEDTDLTLALATMGFVQCTDWGTGTTQSGAGVLVAEVAHAA